MQHILAKHNYFQAAKHNQFKILILRPQVSFCAHYTCVTSTVPILHWSGTKWQNDVGLVL